LGQCSFGYVEFYQKESIDIAVSNNNADFWGKNVTIQFSQAEKNKQTNVTTAAVTGPCRVLVNNLHYAISEDMVREIFQVYGEVSSVSLEVEETGISKGEGVVSFKSAEDARTAVAEANNVEIAGKPIRVAFASELRPDSGIGLTAADLDDEGAFPFFFFVVIPVVMSLTLVISCS
jgi:RNA-binding protein 39